MKIETEEKDGKLYVTVIISVYRPGGTRMKVGLRRLLEVMRKKKIKHGQCLHSVRVTNETPDRCRGTFIFELLKPKLKPKPRKKTTSTSQKVKKKLDND